MVNVIPQFNKLDYILVGQKINESLFIFIGCRLKQRPGKALSIFRSLAVAIMFVGSHNSQVFLDSSADFFPDVHIT